MSMISFGQPTFDISLTAEEAQATLKAVQLSKAGVAKSILRTGPSRKLDELRAEYAAYGVVEGELLHVLDQVLGVVA